MSAWTHSERTFNIECMVYTLTLSVNWYYCRDAEYIALSFQIRIWFKSWIIIIKYNAGMFCTWIFAHIKWVRNAMCVLRVCFVCAIGDLVIFNSFSFRVFAQAVYAWIELANLRPFGNGISIVCPQRSLWILFMKTKNEYLLPDQRIFRPI